MKSFVFHLHFRRGLTLVETLVATVILTVGLAGIVSALLNALDAEGDVLGYLFAADILATQKTELLLSRYAGSDKYETQDIETSAGRYHYQRAAVSEGVDSFGEGLVPVNIQVEWGGLRPKSLDMTMVMIAEPSGEK